MRAARSIRITYLSFLFLPVQSTREEHPTPQRAQRGQPYFDETTNTNARRECEVTLTYLRDGLLTCSMVWAEFEYLGLKFINILMQLCKHFL